MKSKNIESTISEEIPIKIKSYKYRWIILCLYGFATASNIKIATSVYNIADVMCKFYKVSQSTLLIGSSLSGVFTVLLTLPGGFLLSKFGLRLTVIMGSGSSAICGAIFIIAIQPNGFIAFLLSFVFAGTSIAILSQLAPEISAVWFPSEENATATSINFLMLSVGVGMSYVETMILFNGKEHYTEKLLYFRVQLYMILQSSMCMLAFLLCLLLFKDKPIHPPSIAQAKMDELEKMTFSELVKSFRKLLKNRIYIILSVIFGINFSLIIIFPLIINSLIEPAYDNGEKKVGELGMLIVGANIFSSVVFGVLLDKTKQYKYQVLMQLTFSLVLITLFAGSLYYTLHFYLVCLLAVVSWFFYYQTFSIIAEIIAEIVYPIRSSTAIIFGISFGNVFAISVAQLCGWLADTKKTIVILGLLVGVIAIQIFPLSVIKIDKNRSNQKHHIDGLNDTKSDETSSVVFT